MWVTCALCSYYIWVIQVAGLEGQYTIYWHFIRRLNTISSLNSRLKKHHNGMSQSQNGYHGELDFQPRMHQKTLVGRYSPGSAEELTAPQEFLTGWGEPPPPGTGMGWKGTRGKETHDTFPYRHSITLLSARSSPGRPPSIQNAGFSIRVFKNCPGVSSQQERGGYPLPHPTPSSAFGRARGACPGVGTQTLVPFNFSAVVAPRFSAQCPTSNE